MSDEKQYHAALQRIGTALGLPAGSDLTKACVPAIEALKAPAAATEAASLRVRQLEDEIRAIEHSVMSIGVERSAIRDACRRILANRPAPLTDDQWLDLAERHANRDWNSDEPDGYLESVQALCRDFAALPPPAATSACASLGDVPVIPTK